jgi:hypothetical protein
MLWLSQKKATAKATKNKTLPISNQAGIRPEGRRQFELFAI